MPSKYTRPTHNQSKYYCLGNGQQRLVNVESQIAGTRRSGGIRSAWESSAMDCRRSKEARTSASPRAKRPAEAGISHLTLYYTEYVLSSSTDSFILSRVRLLTSSLALLIVARTLPLSP
jgi:hypothetical protein